MPTRTARFSRTRDGARDASVPAVLRRLTGEQRLERAPQGERVLGLQARDRAGDGGVEARLAERLHHVVERVDLEGAQGVLVERGHEHDAARHVGAQRLEHREAVAARHLHVEEQQVGPQAAHDRDGLVPRRRLAHHLDRGLVREQRAHRVAGHRLVVRDHRAEPPPRQPRRVVRERGQLQAHDRCRASGAAAVEQALTLAVEALQALAHVAEPGAGARRGAARSGPRRRRARSAAAARLRAARRSTPSRPRPTATARA